MLFPATPPNPDGGPGSSQSRAFGRDQDLLENSGFEVAALETSPFRETPLPAAWVGSSTGTSCPRRIAATDLGGPQRRPCGSYP
jgi:hypothetical protein